MSAGHGAHEEDDGEHGQPGRRDPGHAADLPVAGRVDDAGAGPGEDQEERPEGLGEEAATLERAVVEALDPEVLPPLAMVRAHGAGGRLGGRWGPAGAQVTQRSLPGTGVSSATPNAAEIRW